MSFAQHIWIFGVRVYQRTLSPLLSFLAPGCGCRFSPTCSHYGIEAVKTHGVRRGSWLAVKRVCRCHPWGGAGFDPIPAEIKVHSSKLKTSPHGS